MREQFALNQVTREQLLEAESASYHSAGTCTFYGTANSNQMMMELMGCTCPARRSSIRTRRCARRWCGRRRGAVSSWRNRAKARWRMWSMQSRIVNAIVGLMATGGSTNHALHVPAMAQAAGIIVDWNDFADISAIVPLLARVYPNGTADINQFHAAGGMAFITRELLEAGLLHGDTQTVAGKGLAAYTQEPWMDGDRIAWRDGAKVTLDDNILRPVSSPFETEGGIRLLTGNLGRGVIKISSVPKDRRVIDAPAAVFQSQAEFQAAFKTGKLDRDFVAVVRFQGPRANGMPELHSLTPALTVLQNKGFRVALLTDGRMSGASGAVPAAIHMTPGADQDSLLARLQDGDRIILDAEEGRLEVVADAAELAARPRAMTPPAGHGWGRELFAPLRALAGDAEMGGGIFNLLAAGA